MFKDTKKDKLLFIEYLRQKQVTGHHGKKKLDTLLIKVSSNTSQPFILISGLTNLIVE